MFTFKFPRPLKVCSHSIEFDPARLWLAGIATCCVAALVTPVHASDSDTPRVQVPYTKVAPKIDGVLEEIWNQAGIIDDFHQIIPVDGAPASEHTEIRIMYDSTTLYIGARLSDRRGRNAIAATVLQHGLRLMEDDRLAIVIDPFGGGRSGYRFEINANGVRNDALYLGSDFQIEWSTIWEVATSVDDEGWTVEVAIPFKSIPYDPKITTWNLNVGRAIRSRGESSVWVSRNRGWKPGIAGEIDGLTDLHPKTGPDIKPGLSISHLQVNSSRVDETKVEPSLEAYYRFTPSLTGALTVNTDFSAIEVDDRQVNLSRFSLFIPEKRDFFLNDSDLFEFGRIGAAGYQEDVRSSGRSLQENARPFFSRRLGLSDSGEAVDLLYGSKVSGRVGRFSIGGLAVRQDSSVNKDGEQVRAGELAVLRVAANVLEESSIGMIGTVGDPDSNIHNSLLGADFRYRNTRAAGTHTVEGEFWYEQSRTSGVHGEDAAFGAGIRVPNGSGLRGALAYRQVQENFNPALGFVSRNGVYDVNSELGYTTIFNNAWFQFMYSGLDVDRVVRLIDSQLQTQTISVRPIDLLTNSLDTIRMVGSFNKDVTDGFTIIPDPHGDIVVPAGNYSYSDYGIEFESASSRMVKATLTYQNGSFYNGDRTVWTGEVSIRPSKHFILRATYELNDVSLPTGDFITRLASLKTEVPFTVKVAWLTLLQYDNVSDVLGMQSRIRWIPKAGSEVILSFSRNYVDWNSNQHFDQERTELTAKANYTLRF